MRISIVFFLLSSYVLFYQTKQNTVVLIQLKSIILCVRSCVLDWWAFPAVSTDGKFLASFTAWSSVVLCSAVALCKGREWIPEVFGEVVISTVQKRHVITADYSHPIDFDSLHGIGVTVGDDGKCLTGVCRRTVMALYVGLSMSVLVCLRACYSS